MADRQKERGRQEREKIGEMREGVKVGERQSDALFTALQCQCNSSLLG